jgi:ABC-type multidrug transport system ATPase subunit
VAGALPAPRPSHAVTAISVRGLRKTYRAGIMGCSARVDAIRDADLDIDTGAVLGVLGPPGAGKSTLLLCLAGLLKADAGSIAWFGRRADDTGRPPGIAYVPERNAHYGFMTVRESVAYHAVVRDGAGRAPGDAVERALDDAALLPVASVRIDELPWSVRPQLSIAQALASAPRVLILDETLSGLNPGARREISRTLQSLVTTGASVVVASDTFDVLDALAPRVAIVIDGQVSEPVDAAALRRRAVLELTVRAPSVARRMFGARVAEVTPDHEVLRIPVDGTTPEAILARCRACGIRVESSRVVSARPEE